VQVELPLLDAGGRAVAPGERPPELAAPREIFAEDRRDPGRVGGHAAPPVDQPQARARAPRDRAQERLPLGQRRAAPVPGDRVADRLALVDHVVLERAEQIALVEARERDADDRDGDREQVHEQEARPDPPEPGARAGEARHGAGTL
jgi:hypothetical protein